MAEQKTAVTQKKTLKLKKQAPAAAPAPATGDAAPVPATMAAGINRAPEAESCKGTAFIALVAALLFAALLVVQFLEWQHYHETPNAFPEVDLSLLPATPGAAEAGERAAPREAPAAEETAEEPPAATAGEEDVEPAEDARDDTDGI